MQKQEIQISGTGINRKKAFTLIELIIVITILAILATIAFVSFSNYTKSARDPNRVSTLTNLQKGLDIYSVQVGRLPVPENPTIFTGGLNGNSLINQGILTQEILQTLSSTPVDPVTGKEYTYSTFGNGKYYQIAGNLETELSQNLGNQTYANTFQTAKLIGNYRYDPSLPSLIIGSGSEIFSPDTCFVVDGGSNTLENCSITKANLSGNTSDSSLVGYWDMESLCNDTNCGETTNSGKLKDLSGNGNYGIFTGGLLYGDSISGSLIGNGLAFNPGSLSGQAIEVLYNEILKPKHITMSAIFRGDGRFNQYPYIITNGDPSSNGVGLNGIFMNMNTGEFLGAYLHSLTGSVQTSQEVLNENIFYYGVVLFDGENLKTYINGNLVSSEKSKGDIFWESEYEGLLIGRPRYDIPQLNGSFQGIIDEVKIYNRALTDEEILQQAKIAGF